MSESAAYARLSGRFASFGETVSQINAAKRVRLAEREALTADFANPQLRDDDALSGRAYNDIVLRGHLAATQNAATHKVGELAIKHERDPAAFEQVASELRGTFMNEVHPLARAQAEIAYNTLVSNHLLSMKQKRMADELEAARLAQSEALGNTSNIAMDALEHGDIDRFAAMAQTYEAGVMSSDLTETEKVKSVINFKRQANLAVSKRDMRDAIQAGNFRDAIEHIEKVRNGGLPMIFPDTGLTHEAAADYLQKQFESYVADYEAGLKAINTHNNLADAELERVREQTRDDAYELQADGALTVEWVKANRNALGDDYGSFLRAATEGGGFKDTTGSPAVYVDLMNRATAGDDVKLEAERAMRARQITKASYDQIVAQITDRRFGGADDFLTTALRVENEFNPAAQRMAAEATAQWVEWKLNNPEATRAEAMNEARAIVSDAALARDATARLGLPKPRFAVGEGRTVDIAATRAATIREYRRRLGIPDEASPEEAQALLMADPDFLQQSVLIARWEQLQVDADE